MLCAVEPPTTFDLSVHSFANIKAPESVVGTVSLDPRYAPHTHKCTSCSTQVSTYRRRQAGVQPLTTALHVACGGSFVAGCSVCRSGGTSFIKSSPGRCV
jgi:hypothetical protein